MTDQNVLDSATDALAPALSAFTEMFQSLNMPDWAMYALPVACLSVYGLIDAKRKGSKFKGVQSLLMSGVIFVAAIFLLGKTQLHEVVGWGTAIAMIGGGNAIRQMVQIWGSNGIAQEKVIKRGGYSWREYEAKRTGSGVLLSALTLLVAAGAGYGPGVASDVNAWAEHSTAVANAEKANAEILGNFRAELRNGMKAPVFAEDKSTATQSFVFAAANEMQQGDKAVVRVTLESATGIQRDIDIPAANIDDVQRIINLKERKEAGAEIEDLIVSLTYAEPKLSIGNLIDGKLQSFEVITVEKPELQTVPSAEEQVEETTPESNEAPVESTN